MTDPTEPLREAMVRNTACAAAWLATSTEYKHLTREQAQSVAALYAEYAEYKARRQVRPDLIVTSLIRREQG